jgi:cellulose synthase/poly-beta-1,6-N-acetylglucosamine synthase-like glycosyltransferase
MPASEPQTKPKALNLAPTRVQADPVCIDDAEDRPAPDQLKAAATAFAAGGPLLRRPRRCC